MTEEDSKPAEAEAAEEAAPKGPEKKGKRKKKWGEETEAGLQVLNELQTEAKPDGGDDEPAAKKRRSRWEAAGAAKAAIVVPGLEIALPASLAHLADLNPEVLELQRRLNNVSAPAGRRAASRAPDARAAAA
jgi:hypothetical protein